MKADLIVKGKIYTADAADSVVNAFAVKNGKIIYVGDEKSADSYMGDETELLTVNNGLVIPGMTEGHAHISCTTELIFGVNLVECETVGQYQRAILEYAQTHLDEEVIMGVGFENGVFDKIGPTAQMLDEVVPNRPVIMVSSDHHSQWVNSKVLRLCGINEDTPQVENGVIVRYPGTTKPTGWLKEMASAMLKDIMPKMTSDHYKKAILYYQNIALENGVTIAFEPMFDRKKDYELRFRAYEELENEEKLKVTFRTAYTLEPDDGEDKVFSSLLKIHNQLSKYEHIQLNTLKLFIDGVVEGHTAFLREDYADAPGDKGEPMYSQADTTRYVKRALKNGINVHTHAIGDAAIDYILNAYEEASQEYPMAPHRNAITHLQVMKQDHVVRMKKLGIVAVTNPYWHFKNPVYYDKLEVPFLGKERAEKEYYLGTLKRAGIVVSQASDFPVTVPPRTMDCLHIMVNRKKPGDYLMEPLGEYETLSVTDGLKVLTMGGAYQNMLEDTKGSIEVGKDADFCMLSNDVLEMKAEDIYKTQVTKTYIAGKCVWKNIKE